MAVAFLSSPALSRMNRRHTLRPANYAAAVATTALLLGAPAAGAQARAAGAPSPAALKALAARLETNTAYVSAEVARQGGPAVLPYVTPYLRDVDPEIRVRAAKAYGAVVRPPAWAADTLGAALRAERLPDVQTAIVQALAAYGPAGAAAVPALAALIDPAPGRAVPASASEAVLALRAIGPAAAAAAPALVRYAVSTDATTASWALVAIGPAIRRTVPDAPGKLYAAAAAVPVNGATAAFGQAAGTADAAAAAALAAADLAKPDTTVEANDRRLVAVEFLAGVAGRPGGQAAVQQLARLATAEGRLTCMPTNGGMITTDIRIAAAEALGKAGPAARDALPALGRLLNGDVAPAACQPSQFQPLESAAAREAIGKVRRGG